MRKNGIAPAATSEPTVQAQQEDLRLLLGLSDQTDARAVWSLRGEPSVLLLLQDIPVRIDRLSERKVGVHTVPRRWYPTRDPHVRCFLEEVDGRIEDVGVRISKDTFSVFTTVTATPEALQSAIELMFSLAMDVTTFVDFMVTSLTLRHEPELSLAAFARFIEHRDMGIEAAVDAASARGSKTTE